MTELLCRVCLEENELIVHISEKSEEFDADLCTLLQTCGGLIIDDDDPMPKYLCQECTKELLITAKFRKKCEEAQQRFDHSKNDADLFRITEANEELVEETQQIIMESNDNHISTEFYCDGSSGQNVVVAAFEELSPSNELNAINMEETDLIGNEEASNVSSQIETKYAHELHESIIYEPEDIEETSTIDHSNLSTSMQDQLNSSKIQTTHAQDDETAMNAIITKPNVDGVTNRLICDICGAVFLYAHALQRHLDNFHKVETIYSCEQCKSCFSSNENFNKHSCKITEATMFSSKQEAKLSVPSCSYCGKNFRNRFALEMHIRTHTGERPFACSTCPSSFKTKSALEKHMNLHDGRVDYKCTYCHKAFADGSNLKRHLLTHTGERPHVCNICKKSFARVFMLQLHLRTHTGEKPYVCQICERGFAQLATLRSHKLTVHNGGVNQFECSECLASFPLRSKLMNHVKKKHPNLVFSNEEVVQMIEQDDTVNYVVEEEVTADDGDLSWMIAEA